MIKIQTMCFDKGVYIFHLDNVGCERWIRNGIYTKHPPNSGTCRIFKYEILIYCGDTTIAIKNWKKIKSKWFSNLPTIDPWNNQL